MKSTRDKIMDAAERCFARQGIASASVRTITRKAGVNLGAITYHFGTKDNLVIEIFNRRMDPMTRERLDMLRKAREESSRKPVPLRKVLEAIVIPQYKLTRQHPEFVRFLVHMKNEPNAKFMKLINNDFESVYDEIHQALRAALPPMSDQEFFLKLHFVVHLMDVVPKYDFQLQRWIPDELDNEGITDVLIGFLEGGLASPCLSPGAAGAKKTKRPARTQKKRT